MAKGDVKAEALDLTGILGRPKNRIARVGVELEGGWRELPKGIPEPDHDGSVFKNPLTGKQEPPKGQNLSFIGEVPLGPFVPAAILNAVKKYYPHYVDHTCGMHVHMSFESLVHYGWLMVPEFQETMIEYLFRWAKKEEFPDNHHIWQRLKGQSVYCQKKFWPMDQVEYKRKGGSEYYDNQRVGNRYTIVHYCGRQNTIEVRVLPMMQSAEQAVRGVKEVMKITNACLMKLAKKELKASGKVEIGDMIVEEEWFEERMAVK